MFSPSVENLVAQLTRLPGIGQRTAQRLAFHILQRPADEALALASALTEVKERVRFCRECERLLGWTLEDVEREPLRGALADPGQAGQLRDEILDGGAVHQAIVPAKPARVPDP